MRAFLSVVVGYVTMFALVFVLFSIAFLILGTSGSFKPGTYEPSGTWIVVSFVLGFVAAIVGGLVAAAIATSVRPPRVLAALVLVAGLLMAIPTFTAEQAPSARPDELGNVEAMQNAQQPSWVAMLNPLVGAVGVLIGAGIRKRPAV